MSESNSLAHEHVFLGADHANSERRTWWVIALCGAMMLLEIVGGWLFGSLALVADGLHMSTHAGALLLAALAYRYARRHARDPRFSFGTGKLGDLAGFTSAIILAMIALLIFYEAVGRFFSPVPIDFAQALPIAGLGLVVNIASAWLLSGGHHHHHGHSHGRGHDHDHDHDHDHHHHAGRDNNMRAALVHVAADAAVSLAVIIGLLLARAFGWVWMDPLVGVLGAVVILSWSYGLLRDTGAILLDMIPDQKMERAIRGIVNRAGDEVLDLHLWRLGPGHLGAILSVASAKGRDEDFYRARLEGFEGLSHITIEIRQRRI